MDALDALINAANRGQLIVIKRRIEDRLASMQSDLAVGDVVTWKGRRGTKKRGRILKINPKNHIVLADDGVKWRVPATMLVKEENQ